MGRAGRNLGRRARRRARQGLEPELPIIFDWTVAAASLKALEAGKGAPKAEDGQLLAVRTSQRARAQIPAGRRTVYDRLLELGALDLAFLPDTWRSGALMRRAQADLGGVLVAPCGGAGVEGTLPTCTVKAGHPVVPIDVALGASGDDAIVGGQGLARRAMSDASDFFRLGDGSSASALWRRSVSRTLGLPHPNWPNGSSGCSMTSSRRALSVCACSIPITHATQESSVSSATLPSP